jgi:hypothetical protein
LPRDCRWVFAGDWNFVEGPAYKSRNNSYTTSEEEKRCFELFISTFNVQDRFPGTNVIRYN